MLGKAIRAFKKEPNKLKLAEHAVLAAHAFFARRALSRHGIDKLLFDVPASAKPYSPTEMWWLYRDIITRKPKSVIELGCGYSTLVIRAALKANGEGFLHSIDAEQEWIAEWQRHIPPDLAAFGKIEFCAVKRCNYRGMNGHCYDRSIPAAIDYLFVDGPSPRSVPSWSGPAMALDPILWASAFRTHSKMVIEGRNHNAAFLLSMMPEVFNRRRNPPLLWVSFERS